MKKKMNLSKIIITQDELTQLYKIALNIIPISMHDINSCWGSARGYNELITIMLNDTKSKIESEGLESFFEKDYKQMLKNLESMQKALVDLYISIENLSRYINKDSDDLFISKPLNIVKRFEGKYKIDVFDLKINGKSSKTLEIIFPENVLYGIISELITNADKHNKSKSKIEIKWGIQGSRFTLEVHDNGNGISDKLSDKYIPLDLLMPKSSGLHLINRIICLCGGHLFFSKSRHLGGTKVYIDFPIIAYYKRGKIYELRKA
ncbi:MAG: ATP-binding protein [Candidatus Aminicenantes bacterium]|jgi:K+-sensing histidine kinase KdpD